MFGVVVDPASVDSWSRATDIWPDVCMDFEPWSNNRALSTQLAETKAMGNDTCMITWEPWKPCAQDDPGSYYQTGYSMESILRGDHDDYIDLFARALRDSGLPTIYLRFAHEMNGNWYPWSYDAGAYRDAWMYLRDRIRFSRKATNVKFVWSPNPDLWALPPRFLIRVLQYWPPERYVDYIGLTIIERDNTNYSIPDIATRVKLIHDVFGKDVIAAEVNCVLDKAEDWFNALGDYIYRSHPFRALVLAQTGVRSGTTGLNWTIEDHPAECRAVRRLVNALHS